MRGWMKHGILAMVASGIVVAGTAQMAAAQMGESAIKERKAVMKSNSKNNKVVTAYAKKGKGSAEDVAKAAKVLVANANKLAGLFPKGTSLKDAMGKTRAKPDIWMQMPKFEAALDNFKSASQKLASAAESGNKNAIVAAAGDVRKACGGCHKPFRQKKE